MFNEKKKCLYTSKKEVNNIFDKEMSKSYTTSGNGAYKLSTSGNVFIDDFSNLSRYKEPRNIQDVFNTMNALWEIDPLTTLKETVYLRLITRNPKLFDGTKLSVQRGQGLKSEFFNRLMWLATKHTATFKKNLDIFICAGSWLDVFELMRIDLSYDHGSNKHALDWNFLFNFICKGLKDDQQAELIKKYLPQIKTASHCKTLRSQENNYIGKFIANKLFEGTKQEKYAEYRRLKASGTAHEWQKLISQGKFNEINFDKIAGRALSLISNSNFLANHDLETKFYEWISNKPIAKFTGFPYELFGYGKNIKKYQQEVLNKQFLGLIETASKDMDLNSNFIVCLDSSGSMESPAKGTNLSSLTVAKSMALYFSYLLKGRFAKNFLEFNSSVTLQKWEGNTPYENFYNTPLSGYCGSTNFLGVADTLVALKQKGYEESEFPTGVLCVSDGEFDSNRSYPNGDIWSNKPASDSIKVTTFETFKAKLLNGGFSKEFVDNFKLVLWDIPNGYYGRQEAVFESLADAPNMFYMSGFDPAGVAFLTGKTPETKAAPKTMEELFKAAMDQELLKLLRI